jgi:hypothetical protein
MEERGEKTGSPADKTSKHGAGFFGSLKDALLAAGRDEMPSSPARLHASPVAKPEPQPPAPAPAKEANDASAANAAPPQLPPLSPSAEEAARLARAATVRPERIPAPEIEREAVPTTRVVRDEAKKRAAPITEEPARTQLVRGRKPIERGTFSQDPVVGFLVVVGGPGLGAFRPIFEGNNTIGRSKSSRIPLDFGDEAISSEAQAYIRYDSNDRSFLFVPNLAKTNVVSVNEQRPTGAVELSAMDVITLGRTQVAFVPFCGAEFDWSDIAEA